MCKSSALALAVTLLAAGDDPLWAYGDPTDIHRFTAEIRPEHPTIFQDITLAVRADINGILCGRALTLAWFAPISEDLVLYAIKVADVSCPAAEQFFTFEFPLGKLAAGSHSVFVRVIGEEPEYEEVLTFQVGVVAGDHVTLHNRFDVAVQWQDFAGGHGVGHPVPNPSTDSALLWFFAPQNWEMLVKVLDGCALNGHWWILGSGATNVPFTLHVVDRDTGAYFVHENPSGHPAGTIANTAFSTCP